MAIISLSLFNLIKQSKIPNIIINGNITDNKFGIKKSDKFIIFTTSICIKFVKVNNLVICNNHAIDMNIKNIRRQDFIIWPKI